MALAELGLLLTGIIAVVHLLGEKINEELPYLDFTTAFSAGVTVAYVFMMVMPELLNSVDLFGRLAFFLALAGFSTIYLSKNHLEKKEKFVDIKKDFRELHSIFLTLYYLSIGYLITYLAMEDPAKGVILFIPVLFHTAFNSLSMRELHEDVLHIRGVKALIAVSPVLGGLAAILTGFYEQIFYALFGIISGMFFYVALHDAVRPSDEGNELGYILGTVLYSIFIIIFL